MALICPQCGKKSSKVARYCMHCGKSLREVRGETVCRQKIEELKITNLEPKDFITTCMNGYFSVWSSFHAYLTADELEEMIDSCLTKRRKQLLIRACGLDGKAPRSLKEIAREAGVQPDGIREQLKIAKGKIASAIWRANGLSCRWYSYRKTSL